MIYARENPAPEDLAPGNCTSLSSNLTMGTMMLNNSYFNSTRVREEARGSMANSLSMEEMLLEVRSPSPSTPFPQDSAIPVDLAEGSGAAEFMANMLRWENLRNLEWSWSCIFTHQSRNSSGDGGESRQRFQCHRFNVGRRLKLNGMFQQWLSSPHVWHVNTPASRRWRGFPLELILNDYFSKVLLLIWSLIYLLGAAHEASFLGRRIFIDNMVTLSWICKKVFIQFQVMCPSRVIFLTGCLTFVLMVPARLLCFPNLEDRLALVGALTINFLVTMFPHCAGTDFRLKKKYPYK